MYSLICSILIYPGKLPPTLDHRTRARCCWAVALTSGGAGSGGALGLGERVAVEDGDARRRRDVPPEAEREAGGEQRAARLRGLGGGAHAGGLLGADGCDPGGPAHWALRLRGEAQRHARSSSRPAAPPLASAAP
eukprot:1408005-Rhodomonas_salina.1